MAEAPHANQYMRVFMRPGVPATSIQANGIIKEMRDAGYLDYANKLTELGAANVVDPENLRLIPAHYLTAGGQAAILRRQLSGPAPAPATGAQSAATSGQGSPLQAKLAIGGGILAALGLGLAFALRRKGG